MDRLTRFGKFWLIACFAMAFMASGGAFVFAEWAGLALLSVPLATAVLGSSIYFFAYGVEAADKHRTKERKHPSFPQDPYAPDADRCWWPPRRSRP